MPMDTLEYPHRPATLPKFVSGSLLRHILIMAGTGAVGLMAIFAGDLANMLFLSLLGDEAVVAAMGYASSILFLTTAIGIGLMIAASALVSIALGAGRRMQAKRLSVNAHLTTFAVSGILAAAIWFAIPWSLSALGAEGRVHALAESYLLILVPSLPVLAAGMTSSGVLRSVGDANRAMLVTLAGAVVNTALDPVFIFGLGLGIEGAAIASTIARFAVLAMGLYGVAVVHKLFTRPRKHQFLSDLPAFLAIAAPAILTNIATPAANAYVTAAIAPFGDGAVAGWAIIGRIIPVAFGSIFALSGIVGPILGQNHGARRHDRMRDTLTLSLAVALAFTVLAWLPLALLAYPLAAAFQTSGEAETLIVLFCRWVSPLFVFMGALFIANAAFNTLGRPQLSTWLNWGRATVGTVPFVKAGAALAGAEGVLVGSMLGGIVFGALSIWLCYRHIGELAKAEKPAGAPENAAARPVSSADTAPAPQPSQAAGAFTFDRDW